MKRTLVAIGVCLLAAQLGLAYEYPLQFTPNPGYRGLIVAGYRFEGANGDVVVGNCSYYTMSGSGHSGAVRTKKAYDQTCRWDLYGRLLSVKPGAPVAPQPLYTKSGVIVYAQNAAGIPTGLDTRGVDQGFVDTPGPHFTWLTPNTIATVPSGLVYTHVVSMQNDGDQPVNIINVQASALLGSLSIQESTCAGQLAEGKSCSITLRYDPTRLASPNGSARDTITVDVTSDAPGSDDFVQQFTVVTPKQ